MQQQKSLQQQNNTRQNKIKQLQKQLDTITKQSKNLHQKKQMQKSHTNDSIQTQDKNNQSLIEYSPIHTCESLQSQGFSIDMLHGRSPEQGVTQTEWGKTLFQGGIQAESNKHKKLLIQQELKQQPSQKQIVHFVQQKQPLSDILQCHHSISQLSKQSCQQSQIHNPNKNPQLQPCQHIPQPSHHPIVSTSKNLKKSIQLPTTSTKQSQNYLHKNFYNSAIKQKSHCQQCLNRMHQLHEMEFLKNKYFREYIALRAQVDRIKHGSGVSQNNSNNNNNSNSNNNNQQSETYTPRSSLNLIQFYGQPLSSYTNKNNNYLYINNINDQRSQKSSFSFENIQNTLLSQRFALEMQECMKLVDKLLLVERKFIQLSDSDCRLLMDFQCKIERLKYHLGLQTQPKFLQELFLQLDKSQMTIKNIHEKYRKLIQKLCKSYKQRVKRTKEQFFQVNSVMVMQLKDFSLIKGRNSKLQGEIQLLKLQLGQYKDLRSTNIGHQAMVNTSNISQLKGSKDLVNSYQILNLSNTTKQRDPHITFLPTQNILTQAQLQKSSISSCCQAKTQKQLQKLQSKIKTLERQNKLLQKTIKQMKSQILGMKKKSLSDFNQFINAVICNNEERKRNAGVGTDVDWEEGNNDSDGTETIKRLSTVNEQSQQQQKQRPSNKILQNQHNRSSSKSQQRHSSSRQSSQLQQPLVQTLSAIIYDIFSFTSLETDESASIFQPETEQQLIDMLQHIKHFTSKFDLYQKEKQREISQLRKNFLQLLKFFIQHYKIPQQELLQEIHKSSYNNQPLVSYIKNYYQRKSAHDDFSLSSGENKTRRAKSTTNYNKNSNQKENHERDSSEYTFGQKSQSCKDSQVQP